MADHDPMCRECRPAARYGRRAEMGIAAHDPMCQRDEPDHWCECALIARVRADEQAKDYRPDAHRMMAERDAARAELAALRALVADGIDAFRLTKEYVNVPDEHGFVLLPDVPGWSHFDWTERARAVIGGGASDHA